MQSLEEVRHALHARLGATDVPKLVNTRVFLRTGVNLSDIRGDQNADPALVARVVGALHDFGYPLS
ncbi:MAG: hypothetical protein JO040_15710 [Gemmatimonadetes bacterium]|nr:hypothetical protein [Gemmatimonadota bacterium]